LIVLLLPQSIRNSHTQLTEIEAIEATLLLPHFTSDDAYLLGTAIRARLRALFPTQPAVINIALTNSQQLLYHATSRPGTLPNNDIMVARKRKTVLRWGKSSWYMYNKFGGNEATLAQVHRLGESAGSYTLAGGAVPVRVRGVEGAVAVCVVSGLSMQEDHQMVVEGIAELKKCME
jgi:uncharacterized protein (UPF0303 family)